MFGVLFYLFKRFDPTKQSELPWKSAEAGSVGESDAAGDDMYVCVAVSYKQANRQNAISRYSVSAKAVQGAQQLV